MRIKLVKPILVLNKTSFIILLKDENNLIQSEYIQVIMQTKQVCMCALYKLYIYSICHTFSYVVQ